MELIESGELETGQIELPKGNVDLLDSLNILDMFFRDPTDHFEYICLHDDHAYAIGAETLNTHGVSKVLTTIRHPVDMVASKKNLLLAHRKQSGDPRLHEMRFGALETEMQRALYSLFVASYQYPSSTIAFPVAFEHLRGDAREEVTPRICEHLEIPFRDSLNTDRVALRRDGTENELLFAGSSLAHLTSGGSSRAVGNRHLCLSDAEITFIQDRFDTQVFDELFSAAVSDFYALLPDIWRKLLVPDQPHLMSWAKEFMAGDYESAFKEYSARNFGRSNANEAFHSIM